MAKRFMAVVFALSLLANATVAAALDSIQVHLGMADLDAIVSGSKAVPLIEPTVAVEPAFSRGTQSYTVRLPHDVDGITLVLENRYSAGAEFGMVDLNGVAGKFKALTYTGRFGLRGKVIPLPLQPGDNQLRLGFRDMMVNRTTVYNVSITREVKPSAEAAPGDLKKEETAGGGVRLHSLVLTDQTGNALGLSPAFDPETTSYQAVVRKDTNALKLELNAMKGAGVGVDIRSSSGGMKMSRYVELTKRDQMAGSTVRFLHDLSDWLSRRQLTITVKVTAETSPASKDYSIMVTRLLPTRVCRVAQELKPGQSCRMQGGGVFEILPNGCVTDLPELSGESSMSKVRMSAEGLCIRGHVEKGGFRASANADASVWRIDALPAN